MGSNVTGRRYDTSPLVEISLKRFFSLMTSLTINYALVGEEEKVPVFCVNAKCQETSHIVHVFTNVTKAKVCLSQTRLLYI